MKDVYTKLAQHLDRLPAGFPATESGVEIRILKRLFTPDEAQTALALNLLPEPIEVVAERLQLDVNAAEEKLEQMARKGLIFRMVKDGRTTYTAAQFMIGIWEYHVNDLDEALIRDVNEYTPYLMKHTWATKKTKQLRVIPVTQSISAGMEIMAYEQAEAIIKKQSKIVVAPCICRRERAMTGEGCDYPLEACLSFGTGAYYYEKNGLGRSISQEEALAILNEGMEAGLVLQPGNAQKPANICMCCGCCCQVLKNIKQMDNPAQVVLSNYQATVDPQACTGCAACEDRCHMDAIAVTDDDVAEVNIDRCIGCGVCINACDFDALSLQAKPEAERYEPPSRTFETYLNMAKERGLI